MKISAADENNLAARHLKSNRAFSRTVVLVAASFVLGMALGGGWYLRHQKNQDTATKNEGIASVVLSDSTKAILQRIETPVEIRIYSPADTAGLPETLQGFVSRIELLLAEYDQVAEGKIKVIHADPQTDRAARSAAGGLGVLPFSGTSGGIYYLGVAVMCGNRIEVMPQLSPEWEAALESDLSRAIMRVSAPAASSALPVAQAMVTPTPIDVVVSEELLKAFPNLESQPFDVTAKILREAAMEELKSAAIEMQSKVQAAQKALAEARETKSESEQQSALKEFQRVKMEQTAKLNQITAQLQERIIVLQRLKNAAQPTAPAK